MKELLKELNERLAVLEKQKTTMSDSIDNELLLGRIAELELVIVRVHQIIISQL